MAEHGVLESDLEESFMRSGGHGGQNVNKTSTAVVLVHRPTGFRVRCEMERSQAQNRSRAWELLLDKLENFDLTPFLKPLDLPDPVEGIDPAGPELP